MFEIVRLSKAEADNKFVDGEIGCTAVVEVDIGFSDRPFQEYLAGDIKTQAEIGTITEFTGCIGLRIRSAIIAPPRVPPADRAVIAGWYAGIEIGQSQVAFDERCKSCSHEVIAQAQVHMAGVHGAIVFFLGIAAIIQDACSCVVSISAADIKIKLEVIAEVVANADCETRVCADIRDRAAIKLDRL